MKRFWYSVDLKIWKIVWFQKKLKEKEDIVIKNKEYLVNYLECDAQKFIGNRELKRKDIRCIKLSTWQKLKNFEKNYKKNV